VKQIVEGWHIDIAYSSMVWMIINYDGYIELSERWLKRFNTNKDIIADTLHENGSYFCLGVCTGFFVEGSFNMKCMRFRLADRKANNQAFVNERILRFPRSWSEKKCYDFCLKRTIIGSILRW